MFQLLQPIWLFALSGIIIPVIIHLWNSRQGKVLRVGSIAFLQESPHKQSRNIKITDWLLLLMRCLLIALLAILLSKPLWQSAAKNKAGWLLIPKEEVKEAYQHYQFQIDSLLDKGWQFHYFNSGFKKDKLSTALENKGSFNTHANISYWTLLKELDAQSPPGIHRYLFTDDKLVHFTGERAVIKTPVNWFTYNDKDSVETRLADAYLTADNKIRILVSKSTPSFAFYIQDELPATAGKKDQYIIAQTVNGLTVSFNNEKPVAVDTASLFITIYAGKFLGDIKYVRAALQSIQRFTNRKIKVTEVKAVASIPANQDWIFWLSDETVPAKFNTVNLFKYEQGKEEILHATIDINNVNAVDEEALMIYKRSVSGSVLSNQNVKWKDGFGHPLLVEQKNAEGKTNYRFYSRFNPEWNNLTWSPYFPALIMNLVLGTGNETVLADKRVIAYQQVLPVLTKAAAVSFNGYIAATDLLPVFWIAAFVIFFVERLLSFKVKKQTVA